MTLFFLDSSALAKRYVTERGTPLMNWLFSEVGVPRLRCLTLCAAEAFSVIIRHRNAGRISAQRASTAALQLHGEVFSSDDFTTLPAPDELVLAAMPLIEKHNVNTSDALVLRAALNLQARRNLRVELAGAQERVVVVTSDARLLRAAHAEGLPALNPEGEDLAQLEALARG